MIRIDQQYRKNNHFYHLQTLIEYPVSGTIAEKFDETDEANIAFWSVLTSEINYTLIGRSVRGMISGEQERVLDEAEITNGHWWVR